MEESILVERPDLEMIAFAEGPHSIAQKAIDCIDNEHGGDAVAIVNPDSSITVVSNEDLVLLLMKPVH